MRSLYAEEKVGMKENQMATMQCASLEMSICMQVSLKVAAKVSPVVKRVNYVTAACRRFIYPTDLP